MANLNVNGTLEFQEVVGGGATALLNKIYPVGSVYVSTNNTSPASFLGGTWEQLSADAYFKIVTSNGGSLGGTNSGHKIPISSMPSHSHTTPVKSGSYTTINGGGDTWVTIYNNDYVGYTGGGEPYYPYYYGVYAWVRIHNITNAV